MTILFIHVPTCTFIYYNYTYMCMYMYMYVYWNLSTMDSWGLVGTPKIIHDYIDMLSLLQRLNSTVNVYWGVFLYTEVSLIQRS